MEKKFCELKLDEVQTVIGGTIDSLSLRARVWRDISASTMTQPAGSAFPMQRPLAARY